MRSAVVDHVFLITVLGEISDRAKALGELRRVLRPRGRLSVCEQFPDSDFVTGRALRIELAAAGFVEERTPSIAPRPAPGTNAPSPLRALELPFLEPHGAS
jgi:ubiquinone/menaquinone biosynthesis C-methylase UbiE